MEKNGCLCIGSPVRALSRACDSACALYVRGMSGCAHHVPTAAGAVAVGRGFGRPSNAVMHLRTSSDDSRDLARAASSKQRRVAADRRADVGGAAAATKGGGTLLGSQPQRKRAAVMETIAENARCDFDAADCATRAPRPRKRGAATSELAAVETGSGEAFARVPSVAHAC